MRILKITARQYIIEHAAYTLARSTERAPDVAAMVEGAVERCCGDKPGTLGGEVVAYYHRCTQRALVRLDMAVVARAKRMRGLA